MRTNKSLFAITAVGLVVLVGWLVYSHHKQVLATRQAEAEQYFNAEEAFQLPAENGGNTSFKDIEISFRNVLSPNYQSVSVKSIELACTAHRLSHQVDDRISGSEVAQSIAHGEQYNRKDIAAINRYNDYARHGTVSDGSDISWGVNVSITHRVRKSIDSTTPLSVEWLCPAPSVTGVIPFKDATDPKHIPIISAIKCGIQITHIEEAGLNNTSSKFLAEGFVGTNKFNVQIKDIQDVLNPGYGYDFISPSYFVSKSDVPIYQLDWNGVSIDSESQFSQPEIKTLLTWARDYTSQLIAIEESKGKDIEITGDIELRNNGDILVINRDNYNDSLYLIGPLAKPLLELHLAHPGRYTINGRKIFGGHSVLVHSLTKSSN